jgi:hypothetical protein
MTDYDSRNRFEKTKRNLFSQGIPVLFRAGGGFPNRRRAKRPSCISVRIGGALTRIAYKKSQNRTPAHEAGAPTLVRVADKSDEEIAVGHTLANLTRLLLYQWVEPLSETV